MRSIAVILLCMLSLNAGAQTTPSTLGGARFAGPTNSLAPSTASFSVGLQREDGSTYLTSARPTDAVRITGYIRPQAQDIGQRADLFVVDRVELDFMMKNAAGKYVPWNGIVADLTPIQSNVLLSAEMPVDVFTGRIGASANHRIFLGYRVNGALHYTPVPLHLDIRTSGTGAGSISLINNGELAQGKLVFMDYVGPEIAQSELYVTMDGEPVNAFLQDDQIVFLMPDDAPPSPLFRVYAGDTYVQYQAAVNPAPVIDNPLQYADDVIGDLLAEVGGHAGIDSVDFYQDLVRAQQELASLSTAEVAALAAFIKQNLDIPEPALASSLQAFALQLPGAPGTGIFDHTGAPTCSKAFNNVIWDSSMLISAGILANVLVDAAIVTGGGAPLWILNAATFVVMLKRIEHWSDSVQETKRLCREAYRASRLSLGEVHELQFDLQDKLEFVDDIAAASTIKVTYRLPDDIRTRFLQLVARIQGVITPLQPVLDLLNIEVSLPETDEETQVLDGRTLSLADISSPAITGVIESASDTSLNLRFNFSQQPPAGSTYLDFSFTLRQDGSDLEIVVPARLQVSTMKDKLAASALGNWTVTYHGSPQLVVGMVLRPGGEGAYLIQMGPQDTVLDGGYCKLYGTAPGASGNMVNGVCEYPLTWSISQSGSAYTLVEDGELFRTFGTTRTAISLPVTGFQVIAIDGSVNRTYSR